MNKALIHSGIVTLILVALAFSTFGVVLAAYPGPDYDTAVDYDSIKAYSWVNSSVRGHYGSPNYYNNLEFWSVREKGYATIASSMFIWWVIDGVSMEDAVDYDIEYQENSYTAYDYISSRTAARFYYATVFYWLDSTAIIYVS
jgi:hypothetical protein